MYELIEHKKLDTAAASITFSNIPQIYTDLVILLSARSSRSAINDYIAMKFNDSTSNYSSRILVGNGSSASSGTDVSLSAPRLTGDFPAATSTASTFGNMQIYIPNYRSGAAKSASIDAVTENNATTAFQELTAFLWNDTTAINSITLEALAGGTNNFLQHSTATLYGVGRRQGIGRAPLAIGGYAAYDNGYWYHSFPSSGSFTPFVDLDVEYLVIAGGGGGGGTGGGGGGAGGYRSSVSGESSGGASAAESLLSLTASTNYTVTIGAGGQGGAGGDYYPGAAGSNSTFGSITATGGGYGTTLEVAASTGGSGGGGSHISPAQAGGTAISGQGFDGGSGASPVVGGGGGGAGGFGLGATSTAGGNGGSGLTSAITGSLVTRAGGGGGGNHTSATVGLGGIGGGGDAGPYGGSASGFDAEANTGGGGGAGSGRSGSFYGPGGAGGSGIVIVRYKA